MKLQKLVIINLLIVFLVCGLLVTGILKFHSLNVFDKIEMNNLEKQAHQVTSIVKNDIDQLLDFVSDWGVWDDSYSFMQQKKEAYIQGNMTEDALEDIRTIGLLYLDDQFRYYHSYTSEGKTSTYKVLTEQILTKKTLFLAAIESGSQKVLLYNETLDCYFWSVIQPIMTSKKDRLSNGYLLFSRIIDKTYINEISTIFGSKLSLREYSTKLKSDCNGQKGGICYHEHVHLLNKEKAILHICVKDVSDNGHVCLEGEIERSMHLQVWQILTHTLFMIAVAGFVVLLLNMLILDRLIVRPTRVLAKSFTHLGKTGRINMRLSITGPFEVKQLASAANHMLEEIEQLHSKLEVLSRTDELTELFNRRYFNEVFDKELRRAMRKQHPIAMMMLDIDYFKKYNDSYGHGAGDECLKRVAAILKEHVQRATDIVARYGGEEFIILLSDTPQTELELLCRKIIDSLRDAQILHESSPVSNFVSLSIGAVTAIPKSLDDKEKLLRKADKLLYQAKDSGRNQVILNDKL
ncbi:MAG: diguanylate cyclase [Desulfuromonas sp.]|nr:diguanylate cyclase [Desulfuromonas sp.]